MSLVRGKKYYFALIVKLEVTQVNQHMVFTNSATIFQKSPQFIILLKKCNIYT